MLAVARDGRTRARNVQRVQAFATQRQRTNRLVSHERAVRQVEELQVVTRKAVKEHRIRNATAAPQGEGDTF